MTNRIRRVRVKRGAGVEMRATVLSSGVQRADTSRQVIAEDEFNQSALAGLFIAPPYNPTDILQIVERSNALGPCIDAMVTNVALSGWDIAPRTKGVEMDAGEVAVLQSFIDSANSEESLMTVNAKVVREYESVGYGFLEIIRDRKGLVTLLRHGKASTIRLLPRHEQAVPVTYEMERGGRYSTVTELRRFRRFVQIVNGHSTYFKEFGDPRRLNYKTGKFDFEEQFAREDEATELLHFRHDSEDAYGVPRWIAQLPSILGSREAEEVNLRYFEDNTVPPMFLTVSGGRLTGQSFRQLERLIQQQGIGRDRQHKILLLEAVPETSGIDDKGANVSLDVHKLTDARQSDGLFKEYDSANREKVRSSFRLPPVTVGLSQDVTFATAQVSQYVAETQVFAPLRRQMDEMYNKRLVNHPRGLGLKTVMLKSRMPIITNPEMMLKALTALNVMGGLTPRTSIEMANSVLQTQIPQYPEKNTEGWEEWMDKPIIFVTKGTASQDGQAQKDQQTKQIEATGGIGFQPPENGQQ